MFFIEEKILCEGSVSYRIVPKYDTINITIYTAFMKSFDDGSVWFSFSVCR
jgi:hypothetical protein